MANGMAEKTPPTAPRLGLSAPAQPCAAKWAQEKPGVTTPMNTSSSRIARMVTINSKLAAMVTPRMFKVTKIT